MSGAIKRKGTRQLTGTHRVQVSRWDRYVEVQKLAMAGGELWALLLTPDEALELAELLDQAARGVQAKQRRNVINSL